MERSLSGSITFRSNRVALLRWLLWMAVTFIGFALTSWFDFYSIGGSAITATVLTVGLGLFMLAVAVMNGTVNVTFEHDRMIFQDGFRLITGKKVIVRYDRIHTVRILGRKYGDRLIPASVAAIYRRPEIKTVAAIANIQLRGVEEPYELLMTLVERTSATLKVFTGGIGDTIVTKQELVEWLGLNEHGMNNGVSATTDLVSNSNQP